MCADFDELFAKMSLAERLTYLQQIKKLTIENLRETKSTLIRERDEMVAAYNEDIGGIDSQLKELTVVINDPDQPKEVSRRAFEFLKANAGTRYRARILMERIGAKWAFASIVLAPYLQDGRVKQEGMSRASTYWVETDEE